MFFSKRKRLKEEHEELVKLLILIANSSIKYRGPESSLLQRRADARYLDSLLAEYRKRMSL